MSRTDRTARAMRRGSQLLLVTAWSFSFGCGGAPENGSKTPEVVEGLQVKKTQLQVVADEWEVPGSVIAVSTAQVAARTMGTVFQVAVREGDTVKRGQLLAQLDGRELSARSNAADAGVRGANAGVAQAAKVLVAAQAQAEVLQKTYDRYVFLRDEKSISPQEFDEISAKQQAAQANLGQAKAALRQAEAGASEAESEAGAAKEVAAYARVVAPFDGRVVRRNVEPGSFVSPGVPLFIVEQTSRYQLEATCPAAAWSAVKKGATARVQLDAIPGKSLLARVAEEEGGTDPDSHTFKVRIDLPKETDIQSGMFGRAFFPHGEKQAVLVPVALLVNRGQLSGVYVVDDSGLIHWRLVTLGIPRGDQREVLSGLAAGDTVVLNPGQQELDGKRTGAATAGGEKHS